jgi:hypothetical protein
MAFEAQPTSPLCAGPLPRPDVNRSPGAISHEDHGPRLSKALDHGYNPAQDLLVTASLRRSTALGRCRPAPPALHPCHRPLPATREPGTGS